MNKIRRLVATGFYTGYCPIAPGTCGTLLAAGIYLAVAYTVPAFVNVIVLLLAALALAGNVWIGKWSERSFGRKDPQKVVVDEMLGYFVAVFFIGSADWWIIAIAGFVLFRIFDITKPWPIKKLEHLPAGWGVAMDDFAAGVLANIVLRLGLLCYAALFA